MTGSPEPDSPTALRFVARFRRVVSVMATLVVIGLAVAARPLVLVLFGEKWLPCVPYLQVLSFVGAFWPLHLVNLNLLTAAGRSDLFLRLEVVKKILTGLGLLITFRISVMAMVWAVLIVSLAAVFVNAHYTKSLIGYGLLSQLWDLAPYIGVSVLTGGMAWGAGTAFSNSPTLQLAMEVLTGTAFYCTLCWVLRLEIYRSTLTSIFAAFPAVYKPLRQTIAQARRGDG